MPVDGTRDHGVIGVDELRLNLQTQRLIAALGGVIASDVLWLLRVHTLEARCHALCAATLGHGPTRMEDVAMAVKGTAFLADTVATWLSRRHDTKSDRNTRACPTPIQQARPCEQSGLAFRHKRLGKLRATVERVWCTVLVIAGLVQPAIWYPSSLMCLHVAETATARKAWFT